MQKILILEDDTNQLNLLKDTIIKEFPSWYIEAVSSYEDAKTHIEKSINEASPFTLFLLDVQLKKEADDRGGFSIAELIRENKIYYKTPILFLTAVPDENYFALSNFHCYNYIPKPFLPKDIIAQIHQMELTGYLESESIEIVDIQRIIHRIEIGDILYIKSCSHQIEVQCANKIIYSRRYSLENFSSLLDDNFLQCHKQYIVNISKISNIDRLTRYININNQYTIPIGRTYANTFLQQYEKRGFNL